MRFPIQIRSTGGAAADPDPRTSPTTVPEGNIGRIPDSMPNTDQSPRVLGIALEGTAGQTATVQLWVLEDAAMVQSAQTDDPLAEKPSRKYYSYGDPIALSVGAVRSGAVESGSGANAVVVPLPCPVGRVYIQVTARPAADAILKLGWLGAGT